MENVKVKNVAKRLLAICMLGVVLGTTGCTSKKAENGVSELKPINSRYNEVEKCYKYIIRDNKAIKLYNSENIRLLYDKDTYEVKEYLYDQPYGINVIHIYDLNSEELLVYYLSDVNQGNVNYYHYLRDNFYSISLKDINDYIEDEVCKEYYSLEEIKKLEPIIANGLRLIHSEDNKKSK